MATNSDHAVSFRPRPDQTVQVTPEERAALHWRIVYLYNWKAIVAEGEARILQRLQVSDIQQGLMVWSRVELPPEAYVQYQRILRLANPGQFQKI